MSFIDGGGYDWVFVLVAERRRIAISEVRKLAPILVADVLGAATRPPKLLRTSATTEFEFGLVRNIRGSPTSAPQDSCGHPGDISARDMLTVQVHAGTRGC